VTGVPHDFLVGHAVAAGGCDETCPQAMRADGLAFVRYDAGFMCALHRDLTDGIRA
jgi:hypothetical protein